MPSCTCRRLATTQGPGMECLIEEQPGSDSEPGAATSLIVSCVVHFPTVPAVKGSIGLRNIPRCVRRAVIRYDSGWQLERGQGFTFAFFLLGAKRAYAPSRNLEVDLKAD